MLSSVGRDGEHSVSGRSRLVKEDLSETHDVGEDHGLQFLGGERGGLLFLGVSGGVDEERAHVTRARLVDGDWDGVVL